MTHVGKLVHDTLYGLQKDVMKVAVLALASIVYRALKDGLGSGIHPALLRGGPAGMVVVGIIVLQLLVWQQPQGTQASKAVVDIGADGDMCARETSSTGPLHHVRGNPLGVALTLLTLFAIDRLDLFVGLERLALRHVRQFSEIAGPALVRVLTLARPKPPSLSRAPLWVRLLRWGLPPALIAKLCALKSK